MSIPMTPTCITVNLDLQFDPKDVLEFIYKTLWEITGSVMGLLVLNLLHRAIGHFTLERALSNLSAVVSTASSRIPSISEAPTIDTPNARDCTEPHED